MQFILVLLGTNQIAGSAHDFNMNMINKVYLCVYAFPGWQLTMQCTANAITLNFKVQKRLRLKSSTEIFKNIQPQPKIRRSCKKECNAEINLTLI